MVILAAGLARDFLHRRERNISRGFWLVAKCVPRGESISADFPGRDGRLKERKRRKDPAAKFVPGNFAQLRFRIVQIENVHALDAEIPAAAIKLILQVARRHTMAARGDFFGAENSRLDIFAREIFIRVLRSEEHTSELQSPM